MNEDEVKNYPKNKRPPPELPLGFHAYRGLEKYKHGLIKKLIRILPNYNDIVVIFRSQLNSGLKTDQLLETSYPEAYFEQFQKLFPYSNISGRSLANDYGVMRIGQNNQGNFIGKIIIVHTEILDDGNDHDVVTTFAFGSHKDNIKTLFDQLNLKTQI